ncbi:hypothetical protein, partial [Amycolatopsis minnesotensis]|uniref:hypothetical protein n=1 Tax=Amycolatopsis minnesotensis TaxID=337894 RepID=UPI0031DE6435
AADLIEDNAVLAKGRVNWREDKMSIFGGGLVPLDLSDAEAGDDEPFVLHAAAEKVDESVVLELKSTLLAHPGATPVRLDLVGPARSVRYALDRYPVTVTSALRGELKGIRGISVG